MKTITFEGTARECVQKLEEFLVNESGVEKPQLNHFIMVGEHSVYALCGTRGREYYNMTCELDMEDLYFSLRMIPISAPQQ